MDIPAARPGDRRCPAYEQLRDHGLDPDEALRALNFAEELGYADEDQRITAALLFLHYQGTYAYRRLLGAPKLRRHA